MNDRLQQLMAFVRAAETASFSRAARDLGTSQPSVSRMVSALEERLGVKLLLRTTRRVTTTDAGAVFLERARRALEELGEAEDAARGVDSLKGVLRVAMSGAFGTREVIPHLPDFLAENPKLKIELLMSDRTEDLVAEGADVALRLGRLADSGFGARNLATARRHVVAAPTYLARKGHPETLADLAGHECVLGPGLSGRRGWSFTRNGTVTSVTVEGRIQVASADGVIACAKAGLGLALASQWMYRAELDAGDLVPVLPEYELEPVEVHAVYPGGRRPSLKVLAFSDFLMKKLAMPDAGTDGPRGIG
jgi:DNA-binding transcriptional LysR family regulator